MVKHILRRVTPWLIAPDGSLWPLNKSSKQESTRSYLQPSPSFPINHASALPPRISGQCDHKRWRSINPSLSKGLSLGQRGSKLAQRTLTRIHGCPFRGEWGIGEECPHPWVSELHAKRTSPDETRLCSEDTIFEIGLRECHRTGGR